jgi:hypothetical protein
MHLSETPSEWVDIPKVKWREEFQLFLRRGINDRLWQGRLTEWWIHVTARAALNRGLSSSATPGVPVPFQDARAEILFSHLSVLDTKFGFLLTFNSLLFLVPGTGLTLLADVFGNRWNDVPAGALAGLYALSGFFMCVWLLSTCLSLFGLREIVWGDLGFGGRMQQRILEDKPFPVHSKPLEFLLSNPGALSVAEQYYSQDLIIAVAKRSNKFRVAVRLVEVNLGTTLCLAVLCFWIIASYR